MIILEPENIVSELKCGVSKKFICNLQGGKYYFKYNYVDKGTELPNDIVEVFCSALFKTMGYENALDYQFAKYQNVRGCISKSFKYDDDVEINFFDLAQFNYFNKKYNKRLPLTYHFSDDEFEEYFADDDLGGAYDVSLPYIINQVQTFCKEYDLNVDLNKMTTYINDLVIFDYFAGNDDRNMCNFAFLVRNNELINTPIFDNGMAYGLQHYTKEIDLKTIGSHIGLTDYGMHNFFKYKFYQDGGDIALDVIRLTLQHDCRQIFEVGYEKIVARVRGNRTNRNSRKIVQLYCNNTRCPSKKFQ